MTSQTLQHPPAQRDTLVAMARAGDSWGFLTRLFQADASLRNDAGLTLLAVSVLCKLGLRTCAEETLQRLPAAARELPDIKQLRSVVLVLPPDECPADLLRQNLDALGDRWIGQAPASQGTIRFFRASDGNVIRKSGEEWSITGDQRGQAGRVLSEHRTLWIDNPHAALVIAGFKTPWLLLRASEARKRDRLGYRSPIFVIEPDTHAAATALSMTDLAAELRDGHIRLFVGESGVTNFRQFLLDRRHLRLSGTLATDPAPDAWLTQQVGEAFAHALRSQDEWTRELQQRVRSLYEPRNAAWWQERFADPARPLRILIPTSRYSTFVQHSSRDIARSLEAMGHRAQVLIEPDDSFCLATGAYLQAILDLDPDLAICINYPRSAIGDFLPRNLPWVCWIQDQMPHLFDAKLGGSLGELDFTVGHIVSELHEKYRYPVRTSRLLPVPASEHKFTPQNPSDAERKRFTCDVAYVSHQSETPDAQHERLFNELRSNPSVDTALLRAMPVLRDAIRSHVQRPLSTLPYPSVKQVIRNTLRHCLGAEPDEKTVDLLVTGYGDPLADRLMRHETLAWAGAIAERNGWQFHLYGNGWERHPALAKFAKGRLEHDGDLRLSYQLAGCHLQVTYHMLAHPRLCECVLSGGLPLCRLHWTERSMIETWLFRRAWHEGAEFRDDRLQDDIRRSPWTDAPALMRYASIFQCMGSFEDIVPPDEFGTCEGYTPGSLKDCRWGALFHPKLLSRGSPAPLGHPFAFQMVGEQPELFFHNQATLEERVRSLHHSRELRQIRNGIARKRVLAHHTYRAATMSILSLVRDCLGGQSAT